jgi:hypothetical protein
MPDCSHEFVWFLLGGMVLWAAIQLLVARFERHYIHEFRRCDEPDAAKQSTYTRTMNRRVRQLGFRSCGWYVQNRGRLARATLTLWLSPDDLTVATVSGGKMAGIPVKQTDLISKRSEGAVLRTSDGPMGAWDTSGVYDQEVLYKADFNELWTHHQSRLTAPTIELEPFDAEVLLEEFEALERWQAVTLVQKGLARYVDAAETQWRFSTKGAVVAYFQHRRKSKALAKSHRERMARKKRQGA